MPSRPAVVETCSAEHVRLRWRAQCSDCGGCGGRCQLFPGGEPDHIDLPRPAEALSSGQDVEVFLSEHVLLQQAALGYGLPLLGLLAGAAAGAPWGNAASAALAVLGTSLAVRCSKAASARLASPQLRVGGDG